MKLYRMLTVMALASVATGCAFFDEPVSDDGLLIPGSQPVTTTRPTEPATSTPAAEQSDTAGNATTAPQPQPATSQSYLVVAPIDNFPRDAQNIAVVHLTKRNTRRELALCKALMQNMPATEVQELPANPLTVVVWPVPNDNAGTNCIEMISDYEGIELTPEAARRIDKNSDGPYLLTRNLPSNNRMVFDISFMSNNALPATLNQWISLLGSNPADWPEYRRAR